MGNSIWTHTGLMFGLVPVLLNMDDREAIEVSGRWFWCDYLINIIEPIFAICIFIMSSLNEEYEPGYPVKITGTIP